MLAQLLTEFALQEVNFFSKKFVSAPFRFCTAPEKSADFRESVVSHNDSVADWPGTQPHIPESNLLHAHLLRLERDTSN